MFWPVAPADRIENPQHEELRNWAAFLKAYRAQDWKQCDVMLLNLHWINPKKFLYELHSERVASMGCSRSVHRGAAPPTSKASEQGERHPPMHLPAVDAAGRRMRARHGDLR